MALVVRNTFLDFSQEEDDLHRARSSSAPPTCRDAKRENDSAAESTTCETLESENSTMASDIDDDVVSQSSNEHEDLSPAMSPDSSDDEANDPEPSATVEHDTLTKAAAQQKLDQMSQTVMDIWAKLRMVETAIEAETPAETQSTAATHTISPPTSGQRLDGKAPAFTPSAETGEARSLLASARQSLMSVQDVAGVDVSLGPAGTLASISIQSHSRTSKSVGNIVAASKSVLLELAANSQSTYVLGYEAEPFQDDANGQGFFATLASMPNECSACWDIYQRGVCRRHKSCKWQHPGRNELQPVRVVVH